jgi:hypothetical protein
VNDPHEITIRAQALGGQWETFGADRYLGVVPEDVQFTFNAWGPDTSSFVLRRDPAAIHPDLTTWTPIEIEVAGRVVWDGRLKETPINEGSDPTIAVQAEGWQYHLDDDVYSKSYVHTKLGNFVDMRSYPTQDLTNFLTAPQVQTGDGAIVLTLPNGSVVPTAPSYGVCGVYLDLGYLDAAKRVVVSYNLSNNNVNIAFQIAIVNTLPTSAGAGSTLALCNTSGSTTGVTGSGRYVVLQVRNDTGSPQTMAADVWARIWAIQVFGSTTYESSSASILKADTVVKDALQTAPLLSTDVSNVSAGTFSIPEFSLDGNHTPREIINAVNAYENYETRILLGRRMAFRPRVSASAYEIGEWSGADFQDASANAGDEIFNRVIVQGTGPDGVQMSVMNLTAGPPWGTAPEAIIPNTGFEVNTTGWTVTGGIGTLTRDTGQFHTGVASGLATANGSGQFNVDTNITGLTPGRSYQFTFYVRRLAALNSFFFVEAEAVGSTYLSDPDLSFYNAAVSGFPTVNVWVPISVVSTPGPNGAVNLHFSFVGTASVALANLDDVLVLRAQATLADRRSFMRTKILPVDSAITLASGARIGGLFLSQHKTTPFKGGFKAVGQGGVRRVPGGSSIHPAHLDENRAGFDTLLSRLAVVVGSGRPN